MFHTPAHKVVESGTYKIVVANGGAPIEVKRHVEKLRLGDTVRRVKVTTVALAHQLPERRLPKGKR